MGGHRYGGYWTNQKLSVLEKYLNAYTQALKKQGFELIYIDGFAGTGERTIDQSAADLFGEDDIEVSIDGSARIALKTDQPFDQYFFIESRKDRIQALIKLKDNSADREISVLGSELINH